MKKGFAIFFLGIMLFNLIGYRWVIAYMQTAQQQSFVAKIDEADYKDEDLMILKTPINLPYYINNPEFERIDGAIRIDGVEYQYVKRRIFNDSLELLCLPNTAQQKLQTAKSDFFKIANDLQQPSSNKKSSNIIKTVLPEYCEAIALFQLAQTFLKPHAWNHCAPQRLMHLAAFLPDQPPERFSAFS